MQRHDISQASISLETARFLQYKAIFNSRCPAEHSSEHFFQASRKTSLLYLLFLLALFVQLGNACTCTGMAFLLTDDNGVSWFHCWFGVCSAGCTVETASVSISGGSFMVTQCKVSCFQNCQICIDSTTCQICGPGYILASPTICINCIASFGAQCLNCDVTRCLSCPVGYSHDGTQANKPCFQCSTIPGCQTCVDGPVCSVCSSGYAKDLSSSTFFITLASYMTTCLQCSLIPNCQTCANGPVCSVCSSGYVKDLSSSTFFITLASYMTTCFQCTLIPNCQTCVDGPVCSVCSSGYVKDLSSSTFFITLASYMTTCFQCTLIPNCQTCANGPVCSVCSSGYAKDLSSSTFFITLASYMTTCLQCSLIPNCQTCANGPVCILCNSGFGVDLSGQCTVCSSLFSSCALCTSYNTGCSKCIEVTNIYEINNLCKHCAQIDPQCVSCQPNSDNSDLVCNNCTSNYFINLAQNRCIKCSTVIDDCEQCIYNSTTAKVQCTLCSSQYLVDSKFWCQQCKVHIYYKRMCYYLPGCSSLAVINGTLICLACTMPNFQFSIKIKKCVCQKGFIFNTFDETCIGKCGDGMKVSSEDCDDGNLNFGDGCDEMCKIQTKFKCTESNSSLSTCILHQNVLLSLDYILKLQGENKAELYFKLEPAPSLLKMIDWQKSIKFEFHAIDRKPIISYSYENGVLKVLMGYFGNIESKICQISVNFNSSTIVSNPQPLLFEISGKNEQLNYESDSLNSSQKTVSIISFALGIAALCCFIVSSYFHKLIGLETLQFIQLIYFSRILFSGSSQSNVMALNSLKYSNGYKEINLSGAQANANISEMPPLFVKIQLQMYYLDNCNMMIIPILLATLAYSLYFLRRSRLYSRYHEAKQIAIRDKILDMSRKITWIFQNFIFSYTLALLYLTVFQMLLYEMSDLSNSNQANPLYITMSFSVSLVILFYIFSIFCSQTIQGLKNYFQSRQNKQNHFNQSKALNDQSDNDYHPLYVPFYLLYQSSIIFLINTVLVKFTYAAEVTAGLILVYTIIFILWKPYLQSIHNYANIYHQFVLIMFFTLEILGKLNFLDDTFKIASLYATAALILLALFVQTIRVYIFRNSLQRKYVVEKAQSQQKTGERKNMKSNNPYEVVKQQKMQRIEQIIGENQTLKMTNYTILGRQMLSKRLREQNFIEEQQILKNEKLLSNQIEDDKESLKKLKERMRIKTEAHEQWIFK